MINNEKDKNNLSKTQFYLEEEDEENWPEPKETNFQIFFSWFKELVLVCILTFVITLLFVFVVDEVFHFVVNLLF